jgi:uncharacterized protein (TIGR02099 family)
MPIRFFMHSCNRLMRITLKVCAALLVLLACFILVMRYWVLPDIERYHGQIAALLSESIGNTVTIGKIEGDWQGVQPHIQLSDVRILDHDQQLALVLPSVNVRVSWLTLLTAELRLARLEVDRPELLVRRDTQGRILIGGIAVSLQESGDGKFVNWLLHQPHMVASNALLVWVDEQRDAPPLVLQQVNLRIENLFSRHRLALHAIPPETLATPLDVRGEFHGEDFKQWEQWRGQIYTQLDYTDVSLWKAWLNLPQEFNRGRGALRGWWGIEQGKLAHITADMDLHDVAMKLGDDVPEMAVSEMRGRAAWQLHQGTLEISTRNLGMRLESGVELRPTDFYFRTNQVAQNAIQAAAISSELRANDLQLESLVSLANFLPLDPSLRNQLNSYGPRGKVTQLNVQWRGLADHPISYQVQGKFANLSMRQLGSMPGFSGLTMEVNGNDQSGTLHINSSQVVLEAPDVMREPLSLDTLSGQVTWQRKGGELVVHATDVELANADLAGHLRTDYQTQAGTMGILDLEGQLTRGEVRSAARYIPLIALDKAGGDWLNGALLGGHTEDLNVRIKANLSDFPLRDKSDELFRITGHVQDGLLEFDKAWPQIEHIAGELLIEGNSLQIKSNSANIFTARLHEVTATLPDLASPQPVLQVKGKATAENSVFLRYVHDSPVRGYINGFTDHVSATGNGALDLSLAIPLSSGITRVNGSFSVLSGDIALGMGIPPLRNARGSLMFTESALHVNDATADILGGPARLNVEVSNRHAHATAQGQIAAEGLRNAYPQHFWMNRLQGSTAWKADINAADETMQLVLNSDLQGVASTLPPPLGKLAGETMPLRFEFASRKLVAATRGLKRSGVARKPAREVAVAPVQNVVTAQLDNVLSAKIIGHLDDSAMQVEHGIVQFGSTETLPGDQEVQARSGVWIAGKLPEVSLQSWGELFNDEPAQAAPLPLAGANLHIGRLTGYGLNIAALDVNALKRGDGLSAQLTSPDVNGEVNWRAHAATQGAAQDYIANGKLIAHLSNFSWRGKDGATNGTTQASSAAVERNKPAVVVHPGSLPALEVNVDNLQISGKKVGGFTLVGHPEGNGWRMRRLNVDNPDGSLNGEGLWQEATPGEIQTQAKLTLDISDAGKILARSGYPDTVKDGRGRLVADLSWQGGPAQFNYATLNGALTLDTGKGRFIQMDPGIGKLLSVLSLQALPKHITLDFRDVFSQGFQFDNINGNATLRNGVMETQDFHIDGSSAKVTMRGNVNLNNETQNLRVKVLPTVGDSVSLITALVGGPVVGVGTLIANKVLGSPLDKLASFEYNISGTWSDPVVVKLGGRPAK